MIFIPKDYPLFSPTIFFRKKFYQVSCFYLSSFAFNQSFWLSFYTAFWNFASISRHFQSLGLLYRSRSQYHSEYPPVSHYSCSVCAFIYLLPYAITCEALAVLLGLPNNIFRTTFSIFSMQLNTTFFFFSCIRIFIWKFVFIDIQFHGAINGWIIRAGKWLCPVMSYHKYIKKVQETLSLF